MKYLSDPALIGDLSVGGKAHNLARLYQAGFLVPNAIVINAKIPLSDLALEQILEKLRSSGHRKVAVRSSANLEDGSATSFAGIFESYLHLSGLNEVKAAIQKCIDSSRSARVEQYCIKNQIRKDELHFSIIIQAMIEGSVSGVAFTIDPMSGNDRSILIEAVSGTGDRFVQGEVNPDRYHYNWFQESIEASASGISPLLTQEQIKELGELALQIQLFYGTPQDIEWTHLNGKFYILQSRPLTRINFKVKDDWTNANMKDGGVASSVANPFISSLYKMMMNQTMPTYFKSIKMMSEKEAHEWVGIFCSNIYWNLGATKSCVSKVPGYVERELDVGIGVEPNYEGDGAKTSLSFSSAIRAIRVLFALKKSIRERPKKSEAVLSYAEKEFQEYDRSKFSIYTDRELAGKAVQLIDEHWFTIEGGYFYHIYDNSNCRTLFMKEFNRISKRLNLNYLNLVTALDEIPHLDPLIELRKIAEKIYAQSELKSYFISKSSAKLKQEYLSDPVFPLRDEFERFIHKYRFHSYRELDLLVPCWSEDPEQVFDALSGMLKGESTLSSGVVSIKQKELYLKERQKIKSKSFLRALDQHRNLLKIRENLRIESARCLYLIRKTFLEVGTRLVRRGDLDQADDVFFASYQDVCKQLRGEGTRDFKALVLKQKKYYFSFAKFEKPNEIWAKRYEHAEVSVSNQQILNGVGCSTGIAEGTVTVIESIQQMHELQKDSILVTRFIDPAWPVFLLNVKGIVTEAGGILSHGAVISREYGIPAVLSAPRATQILKSGMKIRLNGETGQVTVLEQ